MTFQSDETNKMAARTRNLLKWELRWVPLEMAMVGFGLLLQLRLRLDEAGAFFLFLAVVVSLVVRWRHYGGKVGAGDGSGG